MFAATFRATRGERVTHINFWLYYRSGASGAVGISAVDVSGSVLQDAGNFLLATTYEWDYVTFPAGLSRYQMDNLFVTLSARSLNPSALYFYLYASNDANPGPTVFDSIKIEQEPVF